MFFMIFFQFRYVFLNFFRGYGVNYSNLPTTLQSFLPLTTRPSYTTTASTAAAETASENSESGNIIALFASTSASDGAKVFKKCAACHSIAQGGANKIGPALWGVLGRQAGSILDYKYSKAMAGHGKTWSFEEMNNFLIKPKDWIKGTKMSFAGLKNAKDRAAVILYMNENTDSPLTLQ